MFTGIVERTAQVDQRTETDAGVRLTIRADWLDAIEHGRSISVSGACLTVEESEAGWFETFLAEETRERTYLGTLSEGSSVNIERAMPADGRFEGHIVQGHVDEVTSITGIERLGDDWRFSFAVPDDERYLVPKGSIALDGISLTVASIDREAGEFEVAIIPETYELTTLSEQSVGDPVHVEYDVIAKYVERLAGTGSD